MKVVLAKTIDTDSIVDGPGLRSVIWFQGCSHACLECHNPETHAFDSGKKYDVEDVFKMIDALEDQDGITYSGGDPMFQPEAFLEILKYAKSKGYNNLCYTGFVYENLLKMAPIYKEILDNLDILIDGKFDINKKSFDCKYRGSTNQRVIDLNKTKLDGKLVLLYEKSTVAI